MSRWRDEACAEAAATAGRESAPVHDRRAFLLGLAALAGTALTGCSPSVGRSYLPPPETPRARPWQAQGHWPGHRPGHVYVGVASGGDLQGTLDATGPVGLHRTFHQWHQLDREELRIREDQAAGRMPWVSFKPPPTASPWRDVASGAYDDDLRARARVYAGLDRPLIVTFHHEPHKHDADPPDAFATAWTHVHDVLADETDLHNVASVPVVGEWTFNPANPDANPDVFLPPAVLERCAFLGVDVYQAKSGHGYPERLGRVVRWLDSRGHARLMLGVGETGATDDFGSPTGAEWWARSWGWVESHTDRIGALAYFNSARNNRAGVNWLLTQSEDKLAAFRDSLASPVACRLD